MTRIKRTKLSTVINAIQSHCSEMGMSFDTDARVATAMENLVCPLRQWPRIREELENGGGSELQSEGGKRPKFHSLHSSAALCVNAFAPVKEEAANVRLLGYGPFSVARFEMKLKTGISTPNLDFYLEDDDHVVGIESKYTEWLTPKLPNHDGNLTTYLNRANKLRAVPDGFVREVIGHYASVREKLFLDAAQLVKHTLGLLARAAENDTSPVLAYVYWVPGNDIDLAEHNRHVLEIADFEQRISPFLDFRALSYAELWKVLEDELYYRDTARLLRARYDIDAM